MTIGVVDGSSGGCEVVSPLPNPMLSGDNVDKLPLPPSSGVLVTVQNMHKDHDRYKVSAPRSSIPPGTPLASAACCHADLS